MSKLGNAIALAAELHKDQTTWDGRPYFDHLYEVRMRARERYLLVSDGWNVEVIEIVAILHDAFEDFKGKQPWDDRRLRDRVYKEFGSEVYAALDLLTHNKQHDDYLTVYIERVATNWIARIVKLADLSHNLEAWRIPPRKVTQKDYDRWEKYHRAFVRLMKEE